MFCFPFPKKIFFVFLILVSTALKAQLERKDSLLRVMRTANHDTTIVKACMEISDMFFGQSNDSLFFYSSKALDIIDKSKATNEAEKKSLLNTKAFALNNSGYYNIDKGNVKKGLELYHQSLKLREQIGDKNGIANSLNNIAIVYDEQGNVGQALDYYLRSLHLLEETGEQYGMGHILNNIAFVYKIQGDEIKALEYFQKSLDVRKKINDKKGIAESMNNIALMYILNGQLDKAMSHFKMAYELRKELGLKRGMSNSLLNIGKIHLMKKEYPEAQKHLNMSLELCKETKETRGLVNCYLAISQVNFELKKGEEALLNANKAFDLSQEIGFPELIQESANAKKNAYTLKGEYKKALEMYDLYVLMKDSVLRKENQTAAAQKELQYAFEKKAATDSLRNAAAVSLEALKHDQEIAKQRSYTYIGGAGFIVMLLVAGISFNAFRNKKKANKEIQAQKELVEQKQKEILDSITYAQRIQKSLLPTEKYIDNSINRLKR